MANKLIWFTHDHNAHDDPFIQELMDRFDHFGYSAYFIILELLHKDGIGDALVISPSRLCQKLRSRQTRVRELLDFCRTSGKVESDWKPTEVLIQIKKFRERQGKLKSKLLPKLPQPSLKTPLEEKREEKKRKETDIAPSAQEVSILKPVERTGLQKVMRGFKEAKGIHSDDTSWDKKHFTRFARPAADLLKIFDGNAEAAIVYTLKKGMELDAKGMTSWGLEAVSRAAATDPLVTNLTGGEDEQPISALESNRLDGTRRPKRLTSAGEIVGDSLAGLREQAEVSSREQGALARPGLHRSDDGEDFS